MHRTCSWFSCLGGLTGLPSVAICIAGGDLSNDNVRAMTDALVADSALSTVLLWLQLPAQHLADFNRSAASQVSTGSCEKCCQQCLWV